MAEKVLQMLSLSGGSVLAFMAASDIAYGAGYLALFAYTAAIICLTWAITYGIKDKSSR